MVLNASRIRAYLWQVIRVSVSFILCIRSRLLYGAFMLIVV